MELYLLYDYYFPNLSGRYRVKRERSTCEVAWILKNQKNKEIFKIIKGESERE